ncbi:hypothetical protein PHMEG_0008180 [Phytophthora megakarya]|uniref:Uncharacterized protein n=1 Tax=Phytophthora megakarya TaxID=4795 RepID=A0A225WK87_9STRA|nr:hypothetical protein PHMEG_0008180 [Phytophthora megakarya]
MNTPSNVSGDTRNNASSNTLNGISGDTRSTLVPEEDKAKIGLFYLGVISDIYTPNVGAEKDPNRPTINARVTLSAQPDDDEHHLWRRPSKNAETRQKITSQHIPIHNPKSGLPQIVFQTWAEFHEVLKAYERKYYLCFRIQSSETANHYNR